MSRLSGRAMALVLPNLLTIARFGLAAMFPLVPPEWWIGIVIVAALSDAFDGAFSRLFHTTSTFGQILDPIADKVFVGCVLLTLLVTGPLSVWMLVLVAARDIAVAIGCVVAVMRHGWRALRRMPPNLLGKATTALQFLFLLVVIYNRNVPLALLAVTGLASIAAAIDYLQNPHWKTPDTPAPRTTSNDATAQLQHSQGDRGSRPEI